MHGPRAHGDVRFRVRLLTLENCCWCWGLALPGFEALLCPKRCLSSERFCVRLRPLSFLLRFKARKSNAQNIRPVLLSFVALSLAGSFKGQTAPGWAAAILTFRCRSTSLGPFGLYFVVFRISRRSLGPWYLGPVFQRYFQNASSPVAF